jgi:hypothetical protein
MVVSDKPGPDSAPQHFDGKERIVGKSIPDGDLGRGIRG